MTRYAVVGGGLGGLVLAALLADRGEVVDVYEKRPDPRVGGTNEGRSINLAISTRGLHALSTIGAAEDVLARSVPMRGRLIHDLDGTTSFSPYGHGDQAIYSVERYHLNTVLLDNADARPEVTLHFSSQVRDIDLNERRLDVGGEARAADVVIGADGAWSAVREALARNGRFDLEIDHLDHGYKELTIQPGPAGEFRLEPNALHIWPRGDRMMIALPNAAGSFTITLFWPFAGERGFHAVTTPGDVDRVFAEDYADVTTVMPDVAEQYLDAPTATLVTIRCEPWWDRDRAVLVGDAAHAVVPFYGQGANAALEDAVLLDQALQSRDPDIGAALTEFATRRKPDTDALADLTLQNFVEMRDLMASPLFRMRRRVEHALESAFPRLFRSLYSMVTFTRMPYAQAASRARRQEQAVRWVGVAAGAAMLTGLIVATASVRRRKHG